MDRQIFGIHSVYNTGAKERERVGEATALPRYLEIWEAPAAAALDEGRSS